MNTTDQAPIADKTFVHELDYTPTENERETIRRSGAAFLQTYPACISVRTFQDAVHPQYTIVVSLGIYGQLELANKEVGKQPGQFWWVGQQHGH
jgi:hypothetical protein